MTPTDLLVAVELLVTAGIGWRLRPDRVTPLPLPVRTNVVEAPERRGRRGGHR